MVFPFRPIKGPPPALVVPDFGVLAPGTKSTRHDSPPTRRSQATPLPRHRAPCAVSWDPADAASHALASSQIGAEPRSVSLGGEQATVVYFVTSRACFQHVAAFRFVNLRAIIDGDKPRLLSGERMAFFRPQAQCRPSIHHPKLFQTDRRTAPGRHRASNCFLRPEVSSDSAPLESGQGTKK
jgi:hypothetical protein